jgi:RNA polymerase sigma-70 factor (ECF subfamily)
LQFQNFDEPYLLRLRSGDFRTQEHFVKYFSELMHLKLRSRLSSPQAIEDVRQETFVRVFSALHSDGGIRQPERLGAFVNSICNHVLMEQYRSSSRDIPLEDEKEEEPQDRSIDVLDIVMMKEQQDTVREILDKLPEKDRRILTAIFIEEEDKDKVCRDFNVSRDYLRVLLHRAKQEFKSIYMKSLEASVGAGKGR